MGLSLVGFWRRRLLFLGVLWGILGVIVVGLGCGGGVAIVLVGILGSAILLWWWQRQFRRELQFWVSELREPLEQIQHGVFSVRIALQDFPEELRELLEQLNGVAERAESELRRIRQLERVRSDFLSNVSHELRNPLFALRGYLEVLLEQPPQDAPTLQQFLQAALRHARRLETLLIRLLELSRIESGAVRMRLRVVELDELIREVVTHFAEQAEQQRVRLHTELPDEPVEVIADREHIEQVLVNLVDNALKYNRPGGEVCVRVQPQGKRVLVEVADTGIGIPQEHQERVFERFYRVRNAESVAEGSGLGLAIVKHILEAHQAPYELESKPGVGTTVRFWLRS